MTPRGDLIAASQMAPGALTWARGGSATGLQVCHPKAPEDELFANSARTRAEQFGAVRPLLFEGCAAQAGLSERLGRAGLARRPGPIWRACQARSADWVAAAWLDTGCSPPSVA